MSFEDIKSVSSRKVQFTLASTAYPYANTLRRSVMTLVSGIAFRSDPPGIVVENSDISTFSINAPSFLPGIDFSDHLNYWNMGYQAVMITDTSFYRNPNYHKESDTLEKIDFDKMKEVVRGIYFAIINFK